MKTKDTNMPPKPTPPSDEMNTRHQRAVRLESHVRALVDEQQVSAAHHALASEWPSTILEKLPLRLPFEVEALDPRGVQALIAFKEEEADPQLRLADGFDPHHPDRVAILCGPKSELVGFLPEETDDILDQAGSYAELYALRHLKISGMSAGKTTKLQLELVRPDLRQCSACGVLHPGAFENCSECRSRRRRKRMPLEETAERPPVPLHGAIRAVAQNPLLESELPEKK